MLFLGTSKVDSSNRITLNKDITEILQARERSHIGFYFENGDIIIRKMTNTIGLTYNDQDIEEWARKRSIEIDMLGKETEIDIETLNEMRADVEDKLNVADDYRKQLKGDDNE